METKTTFFSKIWKQGNSKIITIPTINIEVLQLGDSETIKVTIEKITKE